MLKSPIVRRVAFIAIEIVLVWAMGKIGNTENEVEDEYGRRQAELDHHANQLNPNNQAFQDALDNRANQLNPNNDAYYRSRGEER